MQGLCEEVHKTFSLSTVRRVGAEGCVVGEGGLWNTLFHWQQLSRGLITDSRVNYDCDIWATTPAATFRRVLF